MKAFILAVMTALGSMSVAQAKEEKAFRFHHLGEKLVLTGEFEVRAPRLASISITNPRIIYRDKTYRPLYISEQVICAALGYPAYHGYYNGTYRGFLDYFSNFLMITDKEIKVVPSQSDMNSLGQIICAKDRMLIGDN